MQTAGIGVTLTSQQGYYWRVRAYTDTVTGEWSEVRAFWVGNTVQAAPNTVQSYQPAGAFQLLELFPEAGTANLADWPTIRAYLNAPVDPTTANADNFIVQYQDVGGRPSVTGGTVPGTYTVSGSVIDFVPTSAIGANLRYTVRLTDELGSTTGQTLPAEITTYFTGAYTPLYGGTINTRSELGGFIDKVSDDEVLFQLWRASLKVNELLATRVHRVRQRVSMDELIAYIPPGVTWGMVRYAELGACVSLLQGHYYDLLQRSGVRTTLATFEYETKTDFLKELRERIKDLQKEQEEVGATFLFDAVVMRTVIPGQFWSPETYWGYDQSYRNRRTFDERPHDARDGDHPRSRDPYWKDR